MGRGTQGLLRLPLDQTLGSAPARTHAGDLSNTTLQPAPKFPSAAFREVVCAERGSDGEYTFKEYLYREILMSAVKQWRLLRINPLISNWLGELLHLLFANRTLKPRVRLRLVEIKDLCKLAGCLGGCTTDF